VRELHAHSSAQAQEADLGTSPDAAVSEENQEVDFTADRQRTSRFDVAATQAHIAKNTIVDSSRIVDLGSAPECISRSFARIGHCSSYYCLLASPLTLDSDGDVLFRITYPVPLSTMIEMWVVFTPLDRFHVSVTTHDEFTL
jgi:hypothetical protein